MRNSLPVFVTVLIAVNAVLSLVTIISIYREGGILKRLRATPLRPPTILTAHVLVKLLLTAVTMILMVLAGRRYFPANDSVNYVSFMLALLLSTWSILSVGFLIASLVPTARFAQPIGAIILYPMIALSGLFVPLSTFPSWLRVVAHAMPLTYAVQLMQGISARRELERTPDGCWSTGRVLHYLYRRVVKSLPLGVDASRGGAPAQRERSDGPLIPSFPRSAWTWMRELHDQETRGIMEARIRRRSSWHHGKHLLNGTDGCNGSVESLPLRGSSTARKDRECLC